MSIRESLERQSANEATAETRTSHGSDNVKSATGAAWLSAVLSMAFFLIVVALGKSYDSAHPLHRKLAESAGSALSGPVASMSGPAIAETSAPVASTPSLTDSPPDAQPDVPVAAQPKRPGKALHRRAVRVRAPRGHSVAVHSAPPDALMNQAQQ
jgi:hypothetical protein